MGKYKELLLDREKQVAQERYPELEFKQEDPIKWELLFTQEQGVVENAREVAKRISASPVVREVGESVFGLFTPEGDSVVFSLGIAIHVRSMGSSIKWMLENNFEETMGIKEGDFFFNNDPYIGGAHSPDQLLVTPIFVEGKLIGWAGGLTHVPETGAIEPGGNPPSAQSSFDEGIWMPCVRIGENDTIRHDMELMIDRGTRQPIFWNLDNRAKAGGIILIREGIKALAAKYGVDYLLKTNYEFIEDTRRACIGKVKTLLFPGTYRNAVFCDVPLKEQRVRLPKDYLMHIPLKLTVDSEGGLAFDFEGVSPAGKHSLNCTIHCVIGLTNYQCYQELFFDIVPNQGISQVVFPEGKYNIPSGSTINPSSIFTACAQFRAGMAASSVRGRCLAYPLYVMGYREELSSGSVISSAMRTGGTDQYGRSFSISNFENSASGMPATAVMDGLDAAYVTWNAETDSGDVEVWEKMFPQIYLGRRIFPDGGGFGKFRGGSGIESFYMVMHSDDVEMGSVGTGSRTFVAPGIMGGYPGATNAKWLITETNMKELIDKRLPLPHSEGDNPSKPAWDELIQGKACLKDALTVFQQVNRYDLWQQINGHSGGFGDPLEREPERVETDLELNLTTLCAAGRVYGVVVAPENNKVDYEA